MLQNSKNKQKSVEISHFSPFQHTQTVNTMSCKIKNIIFKKDLHSTRSTSNILKIYQFFNKPVFISTHETANNENNNPAQTSPVAAEEAPSGPSFEESLRDDQNWREPDRSLVAEMVNLLDQYFSDENLQKDKFLLKHVRRNRAGFVSVKLLTSFKKLKYSAGFEVIGVF